MEGQDAALNTDGQSPSPSTSRDGLVSTVEFAQQTTMNTDDSSDGDAKTSDQKGEATKDDKEAQSADASSASSDQDLTRFDRHPRFIELNTRLKSAEENNRQLLERLAKIEVQGTATTEKKEELPFKDFFNMSDEELLDYQSEKPKEYIENIGNFIRHHIKSGIDEFKDSYTKEMRQQDFETQIEKTFEAYAKDNPDFDEMWDAGQIEKFMAQNPGHNPISAHMSMTMEKRIDEAVKKALGEAETKRRTTRATSTILGPRSSKSVQPEMDAELKEPKKFGGIDEVLTKRMERRMAQRNAQ